MNKKELSKVVREFRAQDWAHRSYSDVETVNCVQRLLHERGIEVADSDIRSVVNSGLYSRLLKGGLGLIGIGLVARDYSGLPEQLSWLPSAAGFGLFILLVAAVAGHFHRY